VRRITFVRQGHRKEDEESGPAPTHPQKWAGMTMFDAAKISNDEALKIADYILKTFQ
jgi:hypothetical protein